MIVCAQSTQQNAPNANDQGYATYWILVTDSLLFEILSQERCEHVNMWYPRTHESTCTGVDQIKARSSLPIPASCSMNFELNVNINGRELNDLVLAISQRLGRMRGEKEERGSCSNARRSEILKLLAK